MAPPVTPLFPAPSLKFTIDGKLNGAIAKARDEMVDLLKRGNEANRTKFEADRRTNPKTPRPPIWRTDAPFSLAIIDLGHGGAGSPLKCGGYNADSLQYTASGAKLAALYAAFALRDLVWRAWGGMQLVLLGVDMLTVPFGGKPAVGPSLKQVLETKINPAILAAAPSSIRAAASARAPMVPLYDDVFTMPAAGSLAKPDFRGDFTTAMRLMIVPSDNDAAGRCIRGVGYAYLNAALEALRLPSKKGEPAIWLAGDYGTSYPYVYVNTTNDALAAQAGSAMAMAQLMAMILNNGVLTSGDCDAMRTLLADSAKGKNRPFLSRDSVGADWRIPRAKVTHAKLGTGPLDVGGEVGSETFRLSEPQKKGKNYCVAFQNVDGTTANLNEPAFMLHRAIEIYET